MTTRRAFMQIAAAAAAPVALGGMPVLARGEAAPRLMLFEDSLAPALAFARRARSLGAKTVAIRQGDVTAAWMQAVRPAWRRGRASICGLTTPAALFCLEQFAFGHGLRVVFHAEHVLLPDGGVAHAVQRSPAHAAPVSLARAGARWPQRLADSLAAAATNTDPRRGRPGPSLAALEPPLPEGATLLTSWIIA